MTDKQATRERFSTIRERRVAKYHIVDNEMEKICSEADEKLMLRELLIRAHFDPDFRFELIWNVEEALGKLPGGCPKCLTGVRFRDEAANMAQEIKVETLERCIRLMPPVWRLFLNRECLEAMIDGL